MTRSVPAITYAAISPPNARPMPSMPYATPNAQPATHSARTMTSPIMRRPSNAARNRFAKMMMSARSRAIAAWSIAQTARLALSRSSCRFVLITARSAPLFQYGGQAQERYVDNNVYQTLDRQALLGRRQLQAAVGIWVELHRLLIGHSLPCFVKL